MDRKDLRIGDRVTYKDVILTISEISELYVLSTKYGYSRTFSIQYLEQIQITENLLNYVGFKDFQFNSNNGWIGVELFGDYGVGTVKIIECPVCFEKYYSHTSNMEYAIFLDSVKKGTNKHYK